MGSSPDTPDENAAHSPAEAWLDVLDGLLRGLQHSLNNRVGTLGAVTQMMGAGGGGASDRLRQAAASELGRLERDVRLLGLLREASAEDPIAVHLPDLLPLVLELQSYHGDAEGVTFAWHGARDVLPVFLRESLFTRCLLIVLADAASRAGEGPRTVTIQLDGGRDRACLRVETGSGGRDTAGGGVPISSPAVRAAREVLTAAGGEDADVVASAFADGGARFELYLPTLLHARARGTRGESDRPR